MWDRVPVVTLTLLTCGSVLAWMAAVEPFPGVGVKIAIAFVWADATFAILVYGNERILRKHKTLTLAWIIAMTALWVFLSPVHLILVKVEVSLRYLVLWGVGLYAGTSLLLLQLSAGARQQPRTDSRSVQSRWGVVLASLTCVGLGLAFGVVIGERSVLGAIAWSAVSVLGVVSGLLYVAGQRVILGGSVGAICGAFSVLLLAIVIGALIITANHSSFTQRTTAELFVQTLLNLLAAWLATLAFRGSQVGHAVHAESPLTTGGTEEG